MSGKKSQNMIKYIIKRILIIFPMLMLVLITTWFLMQTMYANPAANRLGMVMDRETYEIEMRRLGFFDPWYIQLGRYLANFFTGNWGTSYIVQPDKPVIQLIGEIFPRTIELMITSIVVVPIIAIKLGVASAKHKNTSKDILIRFIAILGAGFPVFWVATLVQVFFGIHVQQFTYGAINVEIVYANSPEFPAPPFPAPPGGFRTGFRLIDSIIYNNQIFLWDTLAHMMLPALCMIFVSLAGVSRLTRSSMLDVLDQDYIRTARAKGVKEDVVVNKHALRNALLPTSNLIIGGTAAALLGSLFIEISFNYPGFGYWMVQSIFAGDFLVTNGLLVFATIIILTGTLIADVAYTIIDPRIIYT